MEANNFDTRSDSSARTNSPLLSSNEELKTITIDESNEFWPSYR